MGGGVTGLSTALLARRAGLDVELCEASTEAGGLAGSFRLGDFRFDFGPHELVTAEPELLAFLHELCGEDLLQVRKRSSQYFRERFIAYPFRITDVLAKMPTGFLVRALGGAALARLRALVGTHGDDSLEGWVRRRFGNTLFREYFGPYTQKVWGVPPSELDARTASQRIAADSIVALAVKSLRLQLLGKEEFEMTHDEQRHNFLYVRGGMGELGAAMAREFEALGGRIRLGRKLAAVEHDGRRVRSLRFADGSQVSDFDYVVSTIPLPDLHRMVRPGSSLEGSHLARLDFRGMVFCFAAFDRPQVLDQHWVYFPEDAVPFQRVTDFGHFNAGMTPPGRTGLAFELSSNPGERHWESSDDEILARCTGQLERMGLASAREVVDFRVVRVRRAYPMQTKGYAETVADVLDDLAPIGNLVTLGRQGMFRYCNTDECIEMALDVVPRLARAEASIRYGRATSWVGVSVQG
ncbi:MAG: FAD-dependent oxidoreductase [Planctomycetota bacterium]